MRSNMVKGVIPGVMAGYLFLAYTDPGMQDMVGGMIDANGFVGFILHVIFSAIIGALYTAFFAPNVKLGNPLMTSWWVV